MNVKFDWGHAAQVALGTTSLFLGYLATQPQALESLKISAGSVTLVTFAFGLIYKSIFHSDPPKPSDGEPPMRDKVKTVSEFPDMPGGSGGNGSVGSQTSHRGLSGFVGLTCATALMVTMAGCKQIEAAWPTVERIEQTVANDLAAGEGEGQIASDVCADLGGNSLTDAVCADATILVYNAIELLLKDGKFVGKARTNAVALAAAHRRTVSP